MPVNKTDIMVWCLFGVIATIFLILALIRLVDFSKEFSATLYYLNMEIKSTNDADRKHWLRQRRRLWLSLLPFVKY